MFLRGAVNLNTQLRNILNRGNLTLIITDVGSLTVNIKKVKTLNRGQQMGVPLHIVMVLFSLLPSDQYNFTHFTV
jgi:hypothetical protein